MSNDVKLEPWALEDPDIVERLRDEGMHETADEIESLQDRFEAYATRHQPQREAVLEQALLQCASRFSAYAELHAEKLWDGSLSEAQRQTVRDKVDRNLRYAAEARAALTTPAPAVTEDDQALLADICANMAEVLKPLPGIPDAPGQHAGTRAIEPSDGDEA